MRLILSAIALFAATASLAQDAPGSASAGISGAGPAPASSSASTAPPAPADPSDADLENIVRAAYTAAAGFALTHGNYFARDGVFGPLHDAVAAGLSVGAFGAVAVPAEPAADLEAARVCRPVEGAELRIASNTYGDGITLVAVTDRRYFAYDYDPHKSADIRIVTAADCIKPN